MCTREFGMYDGSVDIGELGNGTGGMRNKSPGGKHSQGACQGGKFAPLDNNSLQLHAKEQCAVQAVALTVSTSCCS
jgi:hypothetical protein